MLADIAKETQVAERADPIEVVHQHGGVSRRVEIEKLAHLRQHAGDVGLQLFVSQQIAFGTLSAGVADHAGRTADDGNRRVAGCLKSPQHEQRQ